MKFLSKYLFHFGLLLVVIGAVFMFAINRQAGIGFIIVGIIFMLRGATRRR